MSLRPSGTVTAIIPAYNNQDQLNRALRSVLQQSLPVTQTIIVDDSSSPRLKIPSWFDSPFELIRLPTNKGPYYARNCAIEKVTTDYVAFLDSDDIWHPNKILEQLPASHEYSEAYFSFSNGDVRPELGQKKPIHYFALSRPNKRAKLFGILNTRASFIANSSVMISTSLLRKFGPFDEEKIGADFRMWVKVLASMEPLIVNPIYEKTFTLYLNEGSVSSNFLKKQSALIYHLQKLRGEIPTHYGAEINNKMIDVFLSVLFRTGLRSCVELSEKNEINISLDQWARRAPISILHFLRYLVMIKWRV